MEILLSFTSDALKLIFYQNLPWCQCDKPCDKPVLVTIDQFFLGGALGVDVRSTAVLFYKILPI